MKLVKPSKTFCSWPPDESGLDQLWASETEPDVGAAAARVLGKADAAMGQELGRLDLPDGLFDQLREFTALFIRDGGVQVLNLDQALAHEHHLGDFGNTSDPRVANELGIES
jgi:hypothetical protein